MNKIFIVQQYLIIERDQVSDRQYPRLYTIYTEDATNFYLKDTTSRGRIVIPKADVDSGDWEDDFQVVFTQVTLRTFLRTQTAIQ